MALPRPIPVEPGEPADPEPRRLLAANNAAVEFYRGQLHTIQARGAREYLRVRGLGALVGAPRATDDGMPWLVGYAPPTWSSLTRNLRASGFTDRELVASGLSGRTRDGRLIDRFRDRLVVPLRDPAGRPLGFVGRAGPAAGPTVAKYINTPETSLYSKGKVLFGVAEQQERIRAGWRPVVVEGPFDAIAVWLSYPRASRGGAVGVAPCGTALTSVHAAALREMPGSSRGIVIAFDDDHAGRAATARAWSELREPAPPGPLLAAGLEGGDPADLLHTAGGHDSVRAAVQGRAYPLVQAVIDHRLAAMVERHPRLLDDIGGRTEAVRAIVPLLFESPEPVEAVRLASKLAERTGVGIDTVAIAMTEHVSASADQAGTLLLQAAATQRPPPPTAPRGAVVLAFPPLRKLAKSSSANLPSAAGDNVRDLPRRADANPGVR